LIGHGQLPESGSEMMDNLSFPDYALAERTVFDATQFHPGTLLLKFVEEQPFGIVRDANVVSIVEEAPDERAACEPSSTCD
jgi:hypothetical protein